MGESKDWFERLTGFREQCFSKTQALLEVQNGRLRSTVNGRSFGIGALELASLADLRLRSPRGSLAEGLKVVCTSGDIRQLHQEPRFCGALFQVASQFNLLEMIGPDVTPEDGVTRYEADRTQGPACAMACGGGTIYRNYFVPVNDRLGQSRDHQLDALADLGAELGRRLGTRPGALWTMKNGYALGTPDGLRRISEHLLAAPREELEELRGRLRIGIQSGVEVTDSNGAPPPIVSQAFCSALPVRYSSIDSNVWEPFARLVLEAAYEATLHAGLLNAEQGGSRMVLLTQLGGGAFGNHPAWIYDAIHRALRLFQNQGLEIHLVSYGHTHPMFAELETAFSGEVR